MAKKKRYKDVEAMTYEEFRAIIKEIAGPCEKNKANRVNIVEYKQGGIRVNETYALLDRGGMPNG